MKGSVAALDRLPDGRAAAALMVDGALSDIFVDPPAAWGPAQPGAIFRARVGRPMKGLGGAMVDLGAAGTGFLREAKGLAPGTALTVQVVTVPDREKAPPVTRRVLFKSRFAIATPDRPGINVSRQIQDEALRDTLRAAGEAVVGDADLGEGSQRTGLILRAAGADADPDAVAEDAAETLALAARVMADGGASPQLLLAAADAHLQAWREWGRPSPDQVDDADGAFDRHGVWEAVAAALRSEHKLPTGDMVIESTRALVAVDVNTGGDTAPGAGLNANIAALRALPRALRLRGLGGQIVVDMAPFSKRDRPRLEQVLQAAIRADSSEISLAGWTPLGHMELQRKRDRAPLKDLLSDVLPDL